MGNEYGQRIEFAMMRSRNISHQSAVVPVWLSVHAPLAAALVLRLASEPTANISYLVIAAYALSGRAHAVRALALSWLFTMLNPGLVPEASATSVGRYAVLFMAAASVVLHSGFLVRYLRVRPFVLLTFLLGLFITGHSMLFSPMADVSVLKALSWMVAMTTLVAAWLGLTEAQRRELSQQIFGGLVLILLLSLPLAFTSVGYLRNGTGFQGILSHPQAFGPAMALLGAWTAARMLGEPRPSWRIVALAGASLCAVLMSEARTAGLAMLLGAGLSVLLAPGFAGRSVARIAPGLRSVRVWGVLFVVLMGSLVVAPVVVGVAENYITKSGRAQFGGLLEAYDRSRGRLIDVMLNNIEERPLTGIGFGVASDPTLMIVERDSIFGLPVGASIEKGVMPLAVLEELGIFGAAFVAFWLLWLLRGSASGGLAPFAVCLTVLLINMGESILFSPGGMGLLPLILLGWAYSSGRPKAKAEHG